MPSANEQLQKALTLSYFYLNFRARTRKEMRDYLKKKQERYVWDDEIVENALKRLEELGYINDLQFVETFIESRKKTKRSGKPLLMRDLIKLGIDRNLVENYLSSYDIDEDSLAYDSLASRWKRYLLFPKEKRFQKAAGFLSRRGFFYDTIKKTIKKFEENIQ